MAEGAREDGCSPPQDAREALGQAEQAGPPPEVKVFQGRRVSVIRIDGKNYASDDPALPPQMRRLFAYLDEYGATPGLMDCLRQLGRKASLRPPAEEDDPEGCGRLRRAMSEDGKRYLPVAAAIGLYIVARLVFRSHIRVVDEIITTVLARLLLPF